jgi:hypothetical protein
MSNIHRLGDYPDARGPGNGRPNDTRNALLGIGGGGSSNPREEKFHSFLHSFCCPLFTWNSFCAVMSALLIIVYIVTLCWGVQNTQSFLAPNYSVMYENLNLVII